MTTYFIEKFQVRDLWGYRDIELDFNKDVNIIIGPNASGKTTILNLLRYILTADLINLDDIEFSSISLALRSFLGDSERNIIVRRTETGFNYKISKKSFNIDISSIPRSVLQRSRVRYQSAPTRRAQSVFRGLSMELRENLEGLVPAVWLPVNRRLPITEEEEDELERDRRAHLRLESVDVRMRTLLRELALYRLGLEAQLSESYKEFERRVLQMILYSKEHDQISSLNIDNIPTQGDKEQLIRAFEVAGLLDNQMRIRIDEHFTASEEAFKRFRAGREDDKRGISLEDLFIIPLIGRTKSIVSFAGELEEFRVNLFEPLHSYESIVNSFLIGKEVNVEEDGELTIQSHQLTQKVGIHRLSSGEKQILILLTQALLWEDKPIVYVVDEPELSLHVTWQEKLLVSLLELGGEIQIIVATHSPDIVGPFVENVIELGVGSE